MREPATVASAPTPPESSGAPVMAGTSVRATALTPEPDPPELRAFVQARFVDIFLENSPRAQWGVLAAGGLMALIWSRSEPSAVPWIWWALVGAMTAWRIGQSARFVRSAPPGRQAGRITALLAFNGVLMSLPLAGFAAMSELQQAALSMILFAMATAGVATTSGQLRSFLAFSAPLLLPLAACWAFTPHPDESPLTAAGLSALILAFLGVLTAVGRQQHAVFQESCRIRFAEQRLNRELEAAIGRETEAHRAKTQFLAAASHDLRQPIHSMNMLVAALGLRELEPRAREIARLLGTVSQTLSGQLDALLDISRLDAGTVQPALAPVRLDELVSSHHQALQPVAAARGLECTLAGAPALAVRTDAALLLRVLSNLTDNALKYNQPGGRITLRTWRDGAQACVEVADTGIGIPLEEQERVFREFYQVGNVERDRTKGLGLGLSIVQRLCALLGARLGLQSAPGIGTTVTLRLPLDLSAPVPTPAPPQTPLRPGLKVLVVDDEAQVREGMRLLLTELGCQVHLAEGSAQAARIAADVPLDALLTDLRLRAGDSGLQVLREVQARQPGLRCALITGDTAPERLREARAAGVPLLHKPVSVEALIGVLGQAEAASPSPVSAGPA